jgi:hypothetical protein
MGRRASGAVGGGCISRVIRRWCTRVSVRERDGQINQTEAGETEAEVDLLRHHTKTGCEFTQCAQKLVEFGGLRTGGLSRANLAEEQRNHQEVVHQRRGE